MLSPSPLPVPLAASRVSAAIPSGVGFLGAATIWKGTGTKPDGDKPAAPEVHGLTTATSVWLSAAIGILCGGALYAPALFTTTAAVVYLRFAPRMPKTMGPADGAMSPSSSMTALPSQSSLSLTDTGALKQPLLYQARAGGHRGSGAGLPTMPPRGGVGEAPRQQPPSSETTRPAEPQRQRSDSSGLIRSPSGSAARQAPSLNI